MDTAATQLISNLFDEACLSLPKQARAKVVTTWLTMKAFVNIVIHSD